MVHVGAPPADRRIALPRDGPPGGECLDAADPAAVQPETRDLHVPVLDVCIGERSDRDYELHDAFAGLATPELVSENGVGSRSDEWLVVGLDVGNAGYQQACVSHALGLARKLGFDGVFFDGVGAKIGYQFGGNPNLTIPEYPTVTSWQAAMYSFLANAGATIHAGGRLVIANIGGAVWTPGLWQKWNGPLDGAEEESWTDGGAGIAQQLPWWTQKLADAAWSEANGKILMLHSWNTTQAGNAYGLASMLLVAGGRSSYSTTNGNIVNYEAWYPEYGLSSFLGGPLGVTDACRTVCTSGSSQPGSCLLTPPATGLGPSRRAAARSLARG